MGLTACSPAMSQSGQGSGIQRDRDESLESTALPALAWEEGHPERKAWSQHIFAEISGRWAQDFMGGASDVESYCPRYRQLNNSGRALFWSHLVAAMSYFESGYVPTVRYHESTMGKDPVTGQPVYSEGLLQMSYSDTTWAPFCEFDWSVDKHLSPTDPRKTILTPERNLSCGIGILAGQIRRRGRITLPIGGGAYWSVLSPAGKAYQIMKMTSQTEVCRR